MLEPRLAPHCERWPSYTLAAPNHFLSLFDFNKESYTRVLWWNAGNKNGKFKLKTHCLLGFKHLKSSTPTKQLGDWYDFKLKSKVKHTISGETRSSTDCFFTPNEFFVWRKTSNLASLHANWIEVDIIRSTTDDHKKVTREVIANIAKKVFSEVSELLIDAQIPPPTGYVSSGSGGIHFYWVYTAVNAYPQTVRVWRMIADALCRPFKKQQNRIWQLDANASKRPAGLLRLPGTWHSQTSCSVLAYTGGQLFQFEQLAASLGIRDVILEPTSKSRLKPKKSEKYDTHHPQHNYSGKHTIGQWWFKIHLHICSHFRRQGFVPVGMRNHFLYINYVALGYINKCPQRAFERLKKLNNELVGWSEAELRGIETASKTHYKYLKRTIADYLEDNLQMDSSFLYQAVRIPLAKDEIKRRQSEAAKHTANVRKTDTFEKLCNGYASLKQTNEDVTQKALAEAVECSVRTVRRYWQELLTLTRQTQSAPFSRKEDNRCPSIYPPSLKLSASRKEIQINYSLEPVELSELGRKCCQRLWTNLAGGLSVPKLSISLVNTEGCYAVNSQIHRL